MPSDLLLKTMNTMHRTILKIGGGRLGWQIDRMPVLQLTTIGRKTGQPRTVILTAPARLGADLVVVASRGGDDQHPAWYLNLQDNPDVQVALRGEPARRMRARVLTAQERDELWPQITTDHKNYAGYQTKTSRVIPLVVLEPQP